jgi:DNA repair exonuclease SbcCD nuclease subunit
MRFIHAADIHLDSPLRGLDAYEGAPVEAIRSATRNALRNLVRLAITERVDFVVLAGDLYDGDWPDTNTGLFFMNRMRELEKACIPVVLLSGNHDAASKITSRLTHPENVRVLPTDRPGTERLDSLRVALHGQGYALPAETRNLAAEYPPPVPGFFNIGILHTALDGREGHEPYAPCALAELLARGYDYWALGHVHQQESVNGTHSVRVEYPGNIQGRHVRECGAKGCLLVTVTPDGLAEPEFRPVDVFRWGIVSVAVSDAESPTEALDAAALAVADAKLQADGRPLAARVMLSCREPLYRRLAAGLKEFRLDLASHAGCEVWIEKVKLATLGQEVVDDPRPNGDATAELRGALAELRFDLEAARVAFASGDCGKLVRLLPPDVRGAIDANRDAIFDRATVLLGAVAPEQAP